MKKSTEALAIALRGIDKAECAYTCSEITPCEACLKADKVAEELEFYLKKAGWSYIREAHND